MSDLTPKWAMALDAKHRATFNRAIELCAAECADHAKSCLASSNANTQLEGERAKLLASELRRFKVKP